MVLHIYVQSPKCNITIKLNCILFLFLFINKASIITTFVDLCFGRFLFHLLLIFISFPHNKVTQTFARNCKRAMPESLIVPKIFCLYWDSHIFKILKMFLTFTSLSLVLLWQPFYLFCSSIVINTVIVTAGNFEP